MTTNSACHAAPAIPGNLGIEEMKFAALVDGVRKNGGKVGPIRLGSEDGVRGVILAGDIKRGEEVLRVPRACWLDSVHTQERADGQDERPVRDKSLLAWKLCDIQSRRPYASLHYIDSLPSDFASHPLCYATEALDLLSDTMRKCILQERASFEEEYQTLRLAYPLDPAPAFDTFLQACACVISRSFAMDKVSRFLIPLADMLNHSFEPTCSIETDEKSCRFVALRDLQCGAPLTWTYVDVSNTFLFMIYGFCTDNHPHDSMAVYGPAVTEGLLQRMHAEGHTPHSLRAWHAFLPPTFADPASRGMLTAIRSTVRRPFRDATELSCEPSMDPEATLPSTRAEELAAMRELTTLCGRWTAQLRGRKSPEAAADTLPAVVNMIDRYRVSQQRIIDHFDALSRSATVVLESPSHAAAALALANVTDSHYAKELHACLDRFWPQANEQA